MTNEERIDALKALQQLEGNSDCPCLGRLGIPVGGTTYLQFYFNLVAIK
jgi:hypothetical protein